METISKNDLLPILRDSLFVNEFEDQDVITVPQKYILKKVYFTDDKTFNEIMNQLRFYMVDKLPYEVYDYVLEYKPELSNFNDFFFEKLTLLKETHRDKLTSPWASPQLSLMNKCAQKGYLNLIKYLHEKYHKQDSSFVLHKNEYSWNEDTCSFAAGSGNLEVLQYLYENGCNWNKHSCSKAASNGHLQILQYLHENGCELGSDTCEVTSKNGCLDCLKYAHDNGCKLSYITCFSAARYGHLQILQYLHENGCEWDSDICADVARTGNLNCLKLLHQKNGWHVEL